MPERVNQQIADRLTERQLLAGRVESRLRRQVWDHLRLLEAEILSALKASDPTDFALLTQRRREVQQLMVEEVDPLIVERYQHIAALLDEALMRLATNEAAAVQQVVNDATEEETITALPSERRLRAGVVHGLFPSATTPTDFATTGRDWWARQGQSIAQRMGDSLTVGVSLEESLTQLTQRVRGTPELGFTDGVMAKARDDAARLVRTQITNAVSEARVAVAERNAAQLMLVHSSVLDSRTCLDGDTLLRTPFGRCPIRECRPGSIVFGGSGEVRRVLATHITQTFQIAKVTLSDGTVILCTPDHHFLTEDLRWVEAQKLQQNTVLRAESML